MQYSESFVMYDTLKNAKNVKKNDCSDVLEIKKQCVENVYWYDTCNSHVWHTKNC